MANGEIDIATTAAPHLAAAIASIVTNPADVPRLGQRFLLGRHSVIVAFHVGDT